MLHEGCKRSRNRSIEACTARFGFRRYGMVASSKTLGIRKQPKRVDLPYGKARCSEGRSGTSPHQKRCVCERCVASFAHTASESNRWLHKFGRRKSRIARFFEENNGSRAAQLPALETDAMHHISCLSFKTLLQAQWIKP